MEDQVLFSVRDEALYLFVVTDGQLKLHLGLAIFSGLLVGECQVVVIDEHVVMIMFFANGVGSVFAILGAISSTFISCCSCPSKENEVCVSFSLTASLMTLSLRVVIV